MISRLQNILYSALILVVLPFWLIKKSGGPRQTAKALYTAITSGGNDASDSTRLPFWLMGWLFGLYIILTSAIAFAAGDRLHLAIVPFAVVSIYAIINSAKNRLFSYN